MDEEKAEPQRAPYPLGDPRRRRIKKGLERIQEAAARLVQEEGLSPEDAKQRATEEQRANTRGDWRAG